MKKKFSISIFTLIFFYYLLTGCHKNQNYPKNLKLILNSSIINKDEYITLFGKYKNCSNKNLSEIWEISTKNENHNLSINISEPNCKLIVTNFIITKNGVDKNYVSENENGIEVQENFYSESLVFKYNDEILHTFFKIDSNKYTNKIILSLYFANNSNFILNKIESINNQNQSLTPTTPETPDIHLDSEEFLCKNQSISEIAIQNKKNYNYYILFEEYLNSAINRAERQVSSVDEAENDLNLFLKNVPITSNSKENEKNTEAMMFLYCKLRYYLFLVNQHLGLNKNRIIYLIPSEDGTAIGKVPLNKFGKKTAGGATGNLQELSDFYIDHQNLGLPNATTNLKFINKNNNVSICHDLNLVTDGNKIIATKFPNAVTTATPCTFEVHNTINNKFETEFTVLLNHTYRYWCEADSNLPAQHTAKEIGLCNKNNNEIKYTHQLLLQKKSIKDLSPISGFYFLSSLDLSENNITELPPHIFDNLSLLISLDLYKNKIEKLPDNIFYNNSVLRIIELDLSKINTIPNNLFSKQKILSSLSLYYYCDEKIPENLFAFNEKLSHLDIYINNYDQISEFLFDNLTEINHIYFHNINYSYNKVPARIFDRLTQFKKLQGTDQFFSNPNYKKGKK